MDNIRAITADGSSDITVGSDTKSEIAAASSPVLVRAVVIDVLDNVSVRDEEALDEIAQDLSNPEDLDVAPRNSIIVRVTSGGTGRDEESNILCFPLFSSHVSLPVKPGEQVWIIFETPSKPETRGYWLSRICEPLHVEDTNYTHGDRRYDPLDPESAKEQDGEGKDLEEIKLPSFQNGPDRFEQDEGVFTILPQDSFEKSFTESKESNNYVIEPVPRFTKRPGDLVLQGSNNATIVLGTGRGYTPEDTEIDGTKTNAQLDEALKSGVGAIDIVVGRGRYHVDPKDLSGEDDPAGSETPKRTEAQVVQNTRNSFETHKNTSVVDEGKPNNTTNAQEGDPDFVNDAARIYLTMKSEPDKEFGLIPDKIPTAFAAEPTEAKDVAAAVLKADEIRIVARKKGTDSPNKDAEPANKNEVEDFQGSIRIIKEGKKDDDAASIYILPDGTIQISGKVIYMGRTSDDGGTEDGAGEKGSEPYLRMSDFEIWADGLIDAINTAFENAQAAINANGDALNGAGSAGASGGATPGFGAPNGPLGAAFGQLIAPGGMSGMYMHSGDKSAIEEYKSTKDAMEAIKSERIFGE